MKIAVAQIKSVDGDIVHNLNEHYKLIKLAVQNGAELIVFPEMSITGYVSESAKKLSFVEKDARLNELRVLATASNIIIVAGAPISTGEELHIGSFIIFPDNTLSIYTKQFLYTGEDEYFSPNLNYNPVIKLNNESVCLAICADITNPEHPKNAKAAGGTIYIASIFYSKGSIDKAHHLLSSYAEKYSMRVFMSNYCGETCEYVAGGKSALWSKDGSLVAGLDMSGTGLLIGTKEGDIWTAEVFSN